MPDTTAAGAPPYFDVLFERLTNPGSPTAVAFGRHVHWGYWPEPRDGVPSAESYAVAAEALCQRLLDTARVKDNLRILDVGCGYGGTLASLNERLHGCELVGLNIDQRQLERTAERVQPVNGNRVDFVHGDACALPFDDQSFDIVLAVECIFHFPDRAAFFHHAGRVLRPGGNLTLSDFVPPAEKLHLVKVFNTTGDEATRRTYGHIDVTCTEAGYAEIAQSAGLQPHVSDNINAETLPTYQFLREHLKSWPDPHEAMLFDRATAQLQLACSRELLHYRILRFNK